MLRYFSRMLRALFVITLGFGGGIAMFVIIVIVITKGPQNAFEDGWKMGLVIGLVFAILAMAVLLALDVTARLLVAKEISDAVWEMEQRREIKLKGTSIEVLRICREALLGLSYVKSVSDDTENLVTRARTGTSWRSPAGEEVEVEINPTSEDECTVSCTSRPLSANVLFDYGKNFENVETWITLVKKTGKALP